MRSFAQHERLPNADHPIRLAQLMRQARLPSPLGGRPGPLWREREEWRGAALRCCIGLQAVRPRRRACGDLEASREQLHRSQALLDLLQSTPGQVRSAGSIPGPRAWLTPHELLGECPHDLPPLGERATTQLGRAWHLGESQVWWATQVGTDHSPFRQVARPGR